MSTLNHSYADSVFRKLQFQKAEVEEIIELKALECKMELLTDIARV